MNTREIAKEYRLSHWAQIMKEREESGLSIKTFCKKIGIHVNSYFYWQRKLRETVCEQLIKKPTETTSLGAQNFVEAKLSEHNTLTQLMGAKTQIRIEAFGLQIATDSDYPADKLATLLRELVLRP